MKGIFNSAIANTNEEYREIVKNRMKLFALMGAAGVITVTVALMARFQWRAVIKEEMLDVYTGFGIGLLIISVVLWILHRVTLNNEEKLKESRIKNSDERLLDISNRAFWFAGGVILAVMYGVALIGGLFFPVLVKMLLAIISVFLVSYLAAYRYYLKRM